MNAALHLAWLDLRRVLRQRETWLWTFVMPLVFFYFFGLLQSGPRRSADPLEALVLEAPDDGVLVDELQARLVERGFAVERVRQLAAAPSSPARVLTLPAHFSSDLLAGRAVALDFRRDSGGSAFEYERFRVTRAAWGVLADVIALASEGRAGTAEEFAKLRAAPRSVEVVVQSAGERRTIPSGREQAVPGTMVMFTMIVLLTASGVALVGDRRRGLLRRLASTPLSRTQLAASKWLAIFALGVVQLSYAVVVGALVFDVDWGPDVAMVGLVLTLWAAFNASLALALASLVATEAQVVGLSVLGANVLAALGGCWWPIEVAPRWMQELASWLPTGWVMNALHRLMLFHSGPQGAWTAVVWLSLAALGLAGLGARRLRCE